jgi:hypothetical protein
MSEKDVYQLRQLVETGLAQKPADLRNTWIIVRGLILDFPGMSHGTKFENREYAVVSPGSLLQKKNRKARLDHDRQRDRDKKRKYEYQKDECRDDIERPLQSEPDR